MPDGLQLDKSMAWRKREELALTQLEQMKTRRILWITLQW
jgi:hypothetical protein